MPTTDQSEKNFGLSPAAADLGLGDQVKQQLMDLNEVRKKSKNGPLDGNGDPTASSMAMSPAVASLLGAAGGQPIG